MFKINDYLTTIDNRLGSPINTFYYTAKYSMREIDSVEWEKQSFIKRMVSNWYTNYVLLKLRLASWYLEWVTKWTQNSEDVEPIVDLNAVESLPAKISTDESKINSLDTSYA